MSIDEFNLRLRVDDPRVGALGKLTELRVSDVSGVSFADWFPWP